MGRAVKPHARQLYLDRFSASEAFEKARALKQKGTDDFQRGEWRAAACKYACGVDFARRAGKAAAEVLTPLLLNEAQCRLKLQEAGVAAKLCSDALEREPNNVKARPL